MSIFVVWFKLKICLLCNQSFIVLRVHKPNIYILSFKDDIEKPTTRVTTTPFLFCLITVCFTVLLFSSVEKPMAKSFFGHV